jgi:DNA-binding transcriptional MerR regulator
MEADTAPEANRHYSADELSALSGTPRRTLRYYIQMGLVDRPIGETRAAHYTWKHLGQLLRIRQYIEAGLSLERIGQLLASESAPADVPLPPPAPGSIVVQSHVHLAPGVQLVIDPAQAGLSGEALRAFVRAVVAAYQGEKNHDR